ncbi:teichoic acid export ATP-binding protein TagH [Gracilibacillus boraciitolerans JCM 21714]|uniref:Teichoic acid export ATP-binding protein TagH n=1 Tax=Gracilibacillus boraciitolerans JCM 21714 TaxID=1298598 RepID=W4VGF6_9BACI|nr:hypothetical protein [Gracilibacillus boraciitolerans]GAE92460.1 teichoic acid export ATP-binding protein TagH [Gracilibacillus boraciitolerans JCM 21714]
MGDSTFANKCLDKMNQFKQQGKTIFFVSHSASQMKSFCDRILWLHYGELRAFGVVEDVIKQYNTYVHTVKKMTAERKSQLKNTSLKKQYINSKDVLEKTKKTSFIRWFIPKLLLICPLLILAYLVGLGL